MGWERIGRASGYDGVAKAGLQAVEVEIDDGRGEERKELAEDEAADDGDAKGATKFGANALAESERKRSEKSCHGGHEDGTEAQETGLVDGVLGRQTFLHFGLHGEVDHEDGVLFDDADGKNDADEGDHGELGGGELKSEKGSDTRRRKSREDGDRVDVALIENAENDVDGAERGDDQHQHRRLRVLVGLCGALKAAVNGGWQPQFALQRLNFYDRISKGETRAEVERKCDGWVKALVIDGERSIGWDVVSKRAKRKDFAGRGRYVDVSEAFRALSVVVGDIQDNVILVKTFVNVGDLPLAEGVAQSVVDVGHVHAEARSGVAIDDQRTLQSADLLIGIDIKDARKFLQTLQ